LVASAHANAASIRAEASITAACTESTARVTATQTQVVAQNAAADTEYASRVFVADRTRFAADYSTDREYRGVIDTSTIEAGATRYAADRDYAGEEYREASETRRLQIRLDYADAKFQVVWPYVQTVVNQALGGSSAAVVTLGFQTVLPYVSGDGALNANDINAIVSNATTRAAARATAESSQAQGELVGRGYASNSLLLNALAVGYDFQRVRAGVNAETATRIAAAKLNAEQEFRGQQAQVQQYSDQQQAILASERNQVQRQVGLLQAVAEMVGGLV
jgi:hypothetical protein